MLNNVLRNGRLSILPVFTCAVALLPAQTSQPAAAPNTPSKLAEPSRADILRGAYGPYRANNDLLFYHLDLRVDPDKKFITGTNIIRFKMLQDGTRIQLELYPTLQIDRITMGKTTLKYERDGVTFFVDFPATLRAGHTYSIDIHYSGNPVETGRFGCLPLRKTLLVTTGSTPHAKKPARASGGQIRTSGATNRKKA
jgi:hypothetical protein